MTVDIAKLRALCDAATPGPWKEHIGAISQLTDGGAGYPLDFYTDSADIVLLKCQECGESAKCSPADVAFIAAARTALPALLDEIERLRTTLTHTCTCSLADGAAPALRHEATCELRIAKTKRIDPSLALSRFAAAMASGDEVEELEAKLAAMTAARDEACLIADRLSMYIALDNPYAKPSERRDRITVLLAVGKERP